MRVVLLSVRSKYVHASLSAWCLAAGVRAFGPKNAEVEVVEATINETDEAVFARVADMAPDVLAISVYIWNVEMLQRLMPRWRERIPSLHIIVGGPEVSWRAEAFLRDWPCVDAVCVGEGERAFALYLQAIQDGSSLSRVPGLCYRSEDGIVRNPHEPPLENPPTPHTPDYFAALDRRIAYVETSRGCPFSCTYCLSGLSEDLRFFDLELSKQTLLSMANSGVQTVKLVDRTFNADADRACQLFSFLIEKSRNGEIPEGVCFHFEVEPRLFDARTLAVLKTAPPGLFQMEAGLQSFYRPTLMAVRRCPEPERSEENLRSILSGGNIRIHLDLIAGLPFETRETFEQGLIRALELKPHALHLGFLKLLHGSVLRERCEEYGYAFDYEAPYEVRASRWMSREDLMSLHDTERALDKLYNSGRFVQTLNDLAESLDGSPVEVFHDFGVALAAYRFSPSLDDLVALILSHFGERVSSLALRDALVCDMLASVRTGRLPPVLYRPDPRLGAWRRAVLNGENHCASAILYGQGERLAVADHTKKDAVTGRHPLKFYEMDSKR